MDDSSYTDSGPHCMVSVCMATCNGEKFIREQIRSILDQLSETDELIVSDDGSRDQTCKIVREFNDPRMTLLTQSHSSGVVRNFEKALKTASGRYIFLADQDDIWKPKKVATVLPLLEKYDVVVTDCELIDENKNRIYPSFFRLRHSGRGIKNILVNSYMGACMAFNRRILEKALPFPRKIPMHDWWIGLIGEMYGKTVFYPQVLLSYRRHGNNLSPPLINDRHSLMEKLRLRWHMIQPLAQRWMKHKWLNF